MKRPEDNKTYT